MEPKSDLLAKECKLNGEVTSTSLTSHHDRHRGRPRRPSPSGPRSTSADETVERMNVRMRLLEAGISPTIQRLEIGRIVLRGPLHISADNLYHQLENGSFPISRATIYNTLKLFVQKGLLRAIVVSPERVFYDSTTGHHHHFYDVETGELIDIPAEEVTVTRYPTPPPDMRTEEVDVLIKVRRTA
jgi:Fur family iron response transcriptional regulator